MRWHSRCRRSRHQLPPCCQTIEKDAPLVDSGEGRAPLVSVANGSLAIASRSISVGDQKVAERVRARGATMLDAPVSGSVPQVQAGTLTIMVGGDEQAYARVEPLLRELGSPTHIGVNGQGLVLKLAINISLAVQMLAFSEGLLLAERAGTDPNLARDVMTQSPIGSPMLKARADLVFDLPDEAWFDVSLMQKTSHSRLRPPASFALQCLRLRQPTRCSRLRWASVMGGATSLRCSRCSVN
jgi:3-hydroxyisobutyrate dehydrogenase-like beta-hydroxyacid dehydrogenase